jgi:hypothetical protein
MSATKKDATRKRQTVSIDTALAMLQSAFGYMRDAGAPITLEQNEGELVIRLSDVQMVQDGDTVFFESTRVVTLVPSVHNA